MKNKPMLSVERELLATALKADASIGATATELVKGWLAMVELRALLDKPPTGWLPCSPNILESGVDCATAPRWSSKEWDVHSHWHPSPAAQHQGEPVAYADPKAFENFGNLAHLGGLYAHEWMWTEQKPGMVALYAEQPAPVVNGTTGDKYKAELYDEVWQKDI